MPENIEESMHMPDIIARLEKENNLLSEAARKNKAEIIKEALRIRMSN